MNFKNLFDLKENPFRMIPDISEKLVWAGFSELKEQLRMKIQRAMKISGSSLILNWGEYGSGKTHAANYFCRKDVLKEAADEVNMRIPFSFKITLPSSRRPVFDLFVSMIDYFDIDEIRNKFRESGDEIYRFIEKFSGNITIQSILKAFFNRDISSIVLKKYLYDTISNEEFDQLSKAKILRKLETDDDRIKVLAGLFSCLAYDQKIFPGIVIWIDEFENISLLNIVNTEATNKFIRDILENTPNHLLIFLNFTLTTFLSHEDLGQYLSQAVISRIRDRIEFKIGGLNELKIYLKELLNHKLYRESIHKNPYHPFTEEAIDFVADRLQRSSLRRYNEAFSMLLELAEFENEPLITDEFAYKCEKDIIGWK